jgi:hypothetical protein
LPSITATHEFVVPRSIPIIFPILFYIKNFCLLTVVIYNDYAIHLPACDYAIMT